MFKPGAYVDPYVCKIVLAHASLMACTSYKTKRVPVWLQRKAVHIGTGMLVLHAEASGYTWHMRVCATIALLCYITRTLPNGVFHANVEGLLLGRYDPGVLSFILVTWFGAWSGMGLLVFAPAYLADPMGAIVGRGVPTTFHRWFNLEVCQRQGRSAIGSTVVWLTSLIVYMCDGKSNTRSVLAASLITMAELFGGAYDNMTVAFACVVSEIGFSTLDQYHPGID